MCTDGGYCLGQGNTLLIFPVQLSTSRVDYFTRLIHITLLYVMTIHTYMAVLSTCPLIVGVGVEKRGAYYLGHGDLSRQHPFGTTLRFTGPVPADSRQ